MHLTAPSAALRLPPSALPPHGLRSTATAVGKGDLGTASRGLGEQRCVVVMQKDRAERVGEGRCGVAQCKRRDSDAGCWLVALGAQLPILCEL